MNILQAARSAMNKIDKNRNILGPCYLRLTPSAFWVKSKTWLPFYAKLLSLVRGFASRQNQNVYKQVRAYGWVEMSV